jgi:hypothetical protein
MANAITNAISRGYDRVAAASDQLNTDKLANRLVEAGYNSGAGRLGGFIAGAIGVFGSAGATAVLWDNMSPIETLFTEMPQTVAAQTGFVHQALEVGGKLLEAGAETALLAVTANFGIQSIDATVDMVRSTKHRSLNLKDFEARPRRISLEQ